MFIYLGNEDLDVIDDIQLVAGETRSDPPVKTPPGSVCLTHTRTPGSSALHCGRITFELVDHSTVSGGENFNKAIKAIMLRGC